MNLLNINLKTFVYLTLTFIVITVVGTITHELGHYTVAKSLGRTATIHYKSVSMENDSLITYFNDTFQKYSYEIKNKTDFPGKEKYFNSIKKFQEESFWITLCGPLQTIITGTIGLFLLFFLQKKHFKNNKVTIVGWVFIFMSLFWLRQTANLFISLFYYFLKGKISFKGDEAKLALHLKLNTWSIEIITGLIGVIVLIIVLKQLPKKIIFTFLLAGCVGGVLGFYLWLIKFGQYIMPH